MIPQNKLESGDILLISDKSKWNIIAWAIRRLTRSHWNHAAMWVEDGYIIEAVNKVTKTAISAYDKPRYDVKIVRIKSVAYKNMTEYQEGIRIATTNMSAKLGKAYDYGAIAWLGIVYTFKALFGWKPPKDNPLQGRNRFFCSEIIAESYYGTSSVVEENMFAGKLSQGCDTTTPRDISKAKTVFIVAGLELD